MKTLRLATRPLRALAFSKTPRFRDAKKPKNSPAVKRALELRHFTLLRAVVVLLLSTISHQPSAFSQGSLAPPSGTPVATMKSLDQIEPRIDLQHAPASAVTSDVNDDFIITQPGSYYLTANIAATKANAVLINVAGVTLDLRGFQISKGSGSGNI